MLKTKKAVASALCLTLALSVAWVTIPVFAEDEQFPWGLQRVRSDCVWDNDHNRTVEQEDWARAGQGVNVAVIDTGVWFEGVPPYEEIHCPRDLNENIKKLVAFRQVDHECEPCTPVCYGTYHGTMCAGIIGALDNDFGVIGNAPKVNLFIVQMMRGTELECAYGINWSVANGADIISISYAWQKDNDMLSGACEYAASCGVLVVAGAGNNESAPIAYPACYDSVVAVGAINESDQRWSDHIFYEPDTGSSFGDELDFVAPGANINSTADGLNCYASDNGTSMACPHVAAAAAMVKLSAPEAAYGNVWNATTILQKLKDTVLDLNATGVGWDEYTGWGLVNAWRANQRPQGSINNDNYTNAKDAVVLGLAFSSNISSLKWNRNADINIDNYVNSKDAVLLGRFFGENATGSSSTTGRTLSGFSSKLKVQPSSLTFYADTTSVGDNFTVSLVADNVTGLYGWELGLHWTSGLIDCVNETVNYAVWSDCLGPWVTPSVDNENGTYHQSLTARDPASSFNGTTWLANLTFQIMQAPPEGGSLSTALTITTESGLDYCLLNSSAAEIPHDFVQGSFKYISARYMRSDTHTINGLQAYKLDTSQSASYLETNVTEIESNTVYWGIRVWKRNSAGTETEVTSGTPVAQVSRSLSGYGIQSATWNCPNTTLASTDSVVFRVYCMNSGNWILQATFTTKRLNAQRTDPATWHVYYWTKRNYISGGLGKTIGYFRWGTPTYNSRTEDFTTT